MLEQVHRLREIADEADCTLGQLALAWILHRDGITSCITGATRASQIEENSGASGINLSQDQMEGIDRIIMPVTFSHE
jgi:aryl-alcohol dehydrogenase-like predicted oxidoreductase